MSGIPNQFRVIIKKKEHYNNPFYYAEKEATLAACRDLSDTPLKLYFYFLSNRNSYEFDLYKTHVEETLNIKKTAYHNAIKTLKDKGYLNYVGQQGANLIYEFNEWPQTSTALTDTL